MWSLPYGYTRQETNFSGGATLGTALAARPATAHTKSAWTTLISSTAFEAEMIVVVYQAHPGATVAATNLSTLADIGIGATPSVLIPDLLVGQGDNQAWVSYAFPLRIPAGSQLSARYQSANTAAAVDQCAIFLYGAPIAGGGLPWVGSEVNAYGVVTTTSGGTLVTGGNAAEGTWTTLGTVAAGDTCRALCVGAQGGQDTTLSLQNFAVDVGVGSSAIVENVPIRTTTNEEVFMFNRGFFPLSTPILSGATVQARMQTHAGTNNILDVVAYGAC